MMRPSGWYAFLGWVSVGACGALVILAAPSFGLFLLPIAGLGFVLAAQQLRIWPEALGAGAGVGVALLAVALLNRDYHPCPSNAVIRLAPSQHSVECGGFDPAPFLVAGLALCALTALVYATLGRRENAGARPPASRGMS
jgi:hypothetical protein